MNNSNATITYLAAAAWIASNPALTSSIIVHPRPIRPHIYHPDQIDSLIELLNDELDDETKMKLVMMLPALQGYLT